MKVETIWELYNLGIWADVVTFIGLIIAVIQIQSTKNLVRRALRNASVKDLNVEIIRKTQRKKTLNSSDPEDKYKKCGKCGGKIGIGFDPVIDDCDESPSLLGYEKYCFCKCKSCDWKSPEKFPVGKDYKPV